MCDLIGKLFCEKNIDFVIKDLDIKIEDENFEYLKYDKDELIVYIGKINARYAEILRKFLILDEFFKETLMIIDKEQELKEEQIEN